MWVLCYFGALMSCIEPPVQHLACEVSGQSVKALEGYAETLHVDVVPEQQNQISRLCKLFGDELDVWVRVCEI